MFILSLIALTATLLLTTDCNKDEKSDNANFVTVDSTQLIRNGKPYNFIGTNLWYAPILGSTGEGGNRERLRKELDTLKELGIENLRILVGADASSANANTVYPYLQPQPGVLNDTLLIGLDYTLAELEKRDMTAVLYLTNSWDWSGGYGFYLRECGYGDSPNASGDGYNDYVKYASDFVREQRALDMFYSHVEKIVSRKNSITGRYYKDEPSIMAWQICNEPRPFAKENAPKFANWLSKTARLIKRLDNNHLVSTGSEGIYGCESNEHTCEFIHGDPNIDYMTIHIWPLNWGWASRKTPDNDIEKACLKAGEYIELHAKMSRRLKKPLVIEEFGFCRRDNRNELTADVDTRDRFYSFIFSHVTESVANKDVIAGCNFWGWGGSGRPDSTTWSIGNDFLCDPPHEPQGWYSVFDCDTSTIKLIKENTTILKNK